MYDVAVTASPKTLPERAVPPLQNGDRLTREEFERRWGLHPEIKKAELIDGQVYLEMTVSQRHGERHGRIVTWVGVYQAHTPGTEALDNVTVRPNESDVLQPDVVLRRTNGGTSRLSDDDCIEGAPELVMEVSASSAAYDLHQKRDVYRRAGVREYLVWQVFENRIDWWELRAGQYALLQPDGAGVVESREFPGLRLKVAAMLEGDMASVLSDVASI